MITVDTQNFEMESDYRWDRSWFVGEQAGVVLDASEHRSKEKNKLSIKITVGFKGPDGGIKVDEYVPPFGQRFRDLLAALAPEYLSGAPCQHCGRPKDLDVAVLVGRWAWFDIQSEFDEQSQRDRARLKAMRFMAPGEAGAQAASPGAPVEILPPAREPGDDVPSDGGV